MSKEWEEYDRYCKTIENYLDQLRKYLDSLNEETYNQVSDNIIKSFEQVRSNISQLLPEECAKYSKILDEHVKKFKIFGIIINLERDSRKRPPDSDVETNKRQHKVPFDSETNTQNVCISADQNSSSYASFFTSTRRTQNVYNSSVSSLSSSVETSTKIVENNDSFASLFHLSFRSQNVYDNTVSSSSYSVKVDDKPVSSSSSSVKTVDVKTVNVSTLGSSSSAETLKDKCFNTNCTNKSSPDRKYCTDCFLLLSKQEFVGCTNKNCQYKSSNGKRHCFYCSVEENKVNKCIDCGNYIMSRKEKSQCLKCYEKKSGIKCENMPCCAPGCTKKTTNRLPIHLYGPGKKVVYCREHYNLKYR